MGFNDHLDEGGFNGRDTFVCVDCVVEDHLARVVASAVQSTYCSYCMERDEYPLAAPFDHVMQVIFDAICQHYADAQDVNAPWGEGQWQVTEVYPHDVVGNFDPGWGSDFMEDIVNSLGWDKYWVEHTQGDWALGTPGDALRWGWDSFEAQIIEKTRYLFLNEPDDDLDSGRPDHIPISRMLDAIGSIATRADLVRIWEPGVEFFRVRVVTGSSLFTEFSDVGAPPVRVAGAGRMNPAGIPYLYLATSEETAIAEVVDRAQRYCVAKFKSTRSLSLLDFIDLPAVPSVFDSARYDERHELIFLRRLRDSFVKNVAKDGREHVDYVPTQVVSEYFRYRFKLPEGGGLNGFIYPSVKNQGGVNVVIFESDNAVLEEFLALESLAPKERC